MKKLAEAELNVVISYIGGSGGYLGNLNHAELASFYPTYCDLAVNTNIPDLTTKKKFMKIFLEASGNEQAQILNGVLERWSLEDFIERTKDGYVTEEELKSKKKTHSRIEQYITSLKGEMISQGELKNDFENVKHTLEQAEILIQHHSYGSAVDRVHTALHAYIKQLCSDQNITFEKNDVKIQDMWSQLKQRHPNFNLNLASQLPINMLVQSIAKLLHNINDVRNKHAYSHPNEEIIEEDEAKFVINLSRAFLLYLDSKA